jgi:outer membrane immunogenic protein
LASAAVLFGTGIASAGGVIGHSATPAGFTWTGGYVGLQTGYAAGTSHVTLPPNLLSNPDPSGFIGGVYAGYSYQTSKNLVLGFDADVSYAHGRGHDILHNTSGDSNADERWRSAFDWTAAVRGRIGYAIGRTLFYAAGGVAFTDLKTAVYDLDTLRGEVSDSKTGWTIGAGIEHAFTDRLVARLEYRFTDFGTKHYPINGMPETFPADIAFKTHDIRIGLAYRF